MTKVRPDPSKGFLGNELQRRSVDRGFACSETIQMTAAEKISHSQRQVDKIRAVVNATPLLQNHACDVQVSIEKTTVALRGELPNHDAKTALLLAVRQAGVLEQISDYVRISK